VGYLSQVGYLSWMGNLSQVGYMSWVGHPSQVGYLSCLTSHCSISIFYFILF